MSRLENIIKQRKGEKAWSHQGDYLLTCPFLPHTSLYLLHMVPYAWNTLTKLVFKATKLFFRFFLKTQLYRDPYRRFPPFSILILFFNYCLLFTINIQKFSQIFSQLNQSPLLLSGVCYHKQSQVGLSGSFGDGQDIHFPDPRMYGAIDKVNCIEVKGMA